MPKQLEVEIAVKNFDGYKPAFKGAMQAYGILAIKSVRWIQHVTGTGSDSVAHYWPIDCEVCKEIASHVSDWSEAAEHTLALDGATPEGFCECGISIDSHTGVYCLFRPASKA